MKEKAKKKKTLLKKWWFWVIIVLILGGIGASLDSEEEKATDDVETTAPIVEEKNTVEEPKKEEIKEEVLPEDEIKKNVEKIIKEDMSGVTVNQLMVNENMSLDDGSYIVLPHLKWDVKNSAKTTKEMLEMYSDNLAAKLADYEVSEVTVFWEVPYHLEGDNVAKFNYERKGDGMAIGDRLYFSPLN